VQLERSRAEFEKCGVAVAAISHDNQATLRHFAERVGIRFTLLSDPESAIIRAFGILNTNLPQDHEFYGIPFPGMYVVDATGTVRAKYFEQNYRERFTPESVLTKEFGLADGPAFQVRTEHLSLLARASQRRARPGNRVTLLVDLELAPRIHVYAPGVRGYRPVSLQIEETPWHRAHESVAPQPEEVYLEAIKERVPVYRDKFRLQRDVTISAAREVREELLRETRREILATLEYQACDDTVCYVPRKVSLRFPIEIEPPDGQRVPDEARRKPASVKGN